MVDKSWLRLLNEPELQILISGATNGSIDVDDMKAHTKFVGGYKGYEPAIRRFWNVVSNSLNDA